MSRPFISTRRTAWMSMSRDQIGFARKKRFTNVVAVVMVVVVVVAVVV